MNVYTKSATMERTFEPSLSSRVRAEIKNPSDKLYIVKEVLSVYRPQVGNIKISKNIKNVQDSTCESIPVNEVSLPRNTLQELITSLVTTAV